MQRAYKIKRNILSSQNLKSFLDSLAANIFNRIHPYANDSGSSAL